MLFKLSPWVIFNKSTSLPHFIQSTEPWLMSFKNKHKGIVSKCHKPSKTESVLPHNLIRWDRNGITVLEVPWWIRLSSAQLTVTGTTLLSSLGRLSLYPVSVHLSGTRQSESSSVQNCTLFQGMHPQWEILFIMPPLWCGHLKGES